MDKYSSLIYVMLAICMFICLLYFKDCVVWAVFFAIGFWVFILLSQLTFKVRIKY